MKINTTKLRGLRSLVGTLLTLAAAGLLGTGVVFGAGDQQIVLTDTTNDYVKLMQEVVQKGGEIVKEMPEINMLVISVPIGQCRNSSESVSGRHDRRSQKKPNSS